MQSYNSFFNYQSVSLIFLIVFLKMSVWKYLCDNSWVGVAGGVEAVAEGGVVGVSVEGSAGGFCRDAAMAGGSVLRKVARRLARASWRVGVWSGWCVRLVFLDDTGGFGDVVSTVTFPGSFDIDDRPVMTIAGVFADDA